MLFTGNKILKQITALRSSNRSEYETDFTQGKIESGI